MRRRPRVSWCSGCASGAGVPPVPSHSSTGSMRRRGSMRRPACNCPAWAWAVTPTGGLDFSAAALGLAWGLGCVFGLTGVSVPGNGHRCGPESARRCGQRPGGRKSKMGRKQHPLPRCTCSTGARGRQRRLGCRQLPHIDGLIARGIHRLGQLRQQRVAAADAAAFAAGPELERHHGLVHRVAGLHTNGLARCGRADAHTGGFDGPVTGQQLGAHAGAAGVISAIGLQAHHQVERSAQHHVAPGTAQRQCGRVPGHGGQGDAENGATNSHISLSLNACIFA